MPEYIYVATNEHMPGLLKIGYSKSPADRLISLQTTGVPSPFDLAGLFPVASGSQCETTVHSALSQFRIDSKREFFALSLPLAMELILPIIIGYLPSLNGSFQNSSSEQNLYFTKRLERDEHTIIHWMFRGRRHIRTRKDIYAIFRGDFQIPVDHSIEHLVQEQLAARLPSSGTHRFIVTTKGCMYVHQFPESE